MINFSLKFIVVFLFLIVNSNSELIDEIKVFGNKRISKESIKVLSSIEIGNFYTDDLINKSLKSLYETNFFENVQISLEDNLIVINVVEYPVIEELLINGIKNKTFLKFIKENIFLKERISYNEILFNKDLNRIREILEANGYYFSTVNTSVSKDDRLNTIKLNIDISLGNKAKINKISFIGNKIFKDKKLLEIIVSEENKFWKFISKNVYLNKNFIDLDKRLLENFYKNRGYYDVNIFDSFVELDQKKQSFNLTYNIDAGARYNFGEFSLLLPDDYNEKDFDKILQIFKKNKNEVYSLSVVNNILSEIEKIASNRLYDFIDVYVEDKVLDNNILTTNFIISDSKNFYIEKINIKGNYVTYEEVIRNKLIVDEGDPLNNLLFNKSINEIKSLRIFKNVDAKITNGSNQNLKIINIEVEEQPTGEIAVAAGYGNNGITTGGSIREKNFGGKGVDINTFIEFSDESLKGELIYSKPNFAYTDNTLFTSIRSLNNDFLSTAGYETKELGFSIGTSFEQFENLYFSPEIELKIEDLSTNLNASNNLKNQAGNYKDLYFNYGLQADLRDNTFNTKDGYLVSFNQELPVVSENNEIINEFNFVNYMELNQFSEMIGKASFYIKSINTLDGSNVRVSKRGNVPYNRLRGFEKGKIGPIDGLDYVGGNFVSALNLSTNLPNLLPTVEILDFNYFIDVANVWGVDYNKSLNKSKIKSSTGIGLNVISPIGPLSFSLAQPITKSSTDKTETFRFNIGTTF